MPPRQKSKPTRKRRTPRPKAVARRPKSLSPADLVESAAVIEIHEQPSSPASADALDFDSGLWGRARTQWMLGDWESLAAIRVEQLESDARRGELAALTACAQMQAGEKDLARRHLVAASRWGCSRQFMVRALLASSEANVARYHGRMGRAEEELQRLSSSAGAFGGDGDLAARARKALSLVAMPCSEARAQGEADTRQLPRAN
jgi:hypothetical protein